MDTNTLKSGHYTTELSRRQQEVYDLLSKGFSSRYIAFLLHLSVRTVEEHVRAIYQKLGLSSRDQLLARYHGLKER